MHILDVSDPASPVRVGNYPSADATGVTVAGARVYLANGGAGLHILDVSNPASPVLVGALDTDGDADAVAVSGNFAYVADGAALEIVDVSNPASPVRVGTFVTGGDAVRVSLAGGHAYVGTAFGGLEIINVSNPAAPTSVASYPTSDAIYGVWLAGNYAYVAETDFGLRVLDITNPAAPVQAGLLAFGETVGVAVTGQYAYLADGDAGLQILDVKDPAAPVRVGAYQTDDFAPHVAVSGRYAYVAVSDAGVDVLDVSNPAAPVRVGHFQTDGYASRVAVSGGHLYVVARDHGLLVLNVSNPATPVLAGFYLTDADPLAVALSGNRAYVAYDNSRLEILDLTNPVDPRLLGSYPTPEPARGVAVSGNHVYLAAGESGLDVVNVSNPAAPVSAGRHGAEGYAGGVAVSGPYAYLACSGTGLQVFDVRNPAAPVLLPGFGERGASHQVVIVGELAFVADDAWGVSIVKVLPAPSERIQVAWNDSGERLVLEQAQDSAGVWLPTPASPVQSAGRQHVTVYPENDARFFRLQGGIGPASALDDRINVREARDRGPTLSGDGLTMVFFSNRRGQDDLFVATRTSVTSPWSEPVALDAINTDGDEVFPALSADGLALFFSDSFAQASRRPGNLGGADLWVSTRANLQAAWQPAVNLGPVVNGASFDTSPCLSSDGRTLFFASLDRPQNIRQGRGSRFDLWMTTRSDPSNPTGWEPPVHLGPVVNTIYGETEPSLSGDGLALYFASDRPSPGRPDFFCADGRCSAMNNIWVARRPSTFEPFGPPVSLGVHFLNLGYMLDPCISPDGSTLFFATSGLAPTPAPFADTWQAAVLPVPVPALSVQSFRVQD